MAYDFDGSNWMRQVVPILLVRRTIVHSSLERVAACGCMVDREGEDIQRRVVSIGSWDSARW